MIDLLAVKEDKPECKGRVYRAKVSRFLGKNSSYTYQETMVPMKRLSCPGCSQCGWFDEDLKEFALSDYPPIINNIKHGELYYLAVVNEHYDWESGILDGFELEFKEMKEKK